ncbi:MAG: exodeoxyribonuclease VII large subunit [Fusobacteriaceae bacterium]|jgi:exodeoxyribonuclease VII large subunit|nr:exodeoxyribonuclease VII large subunit [Fusobacteriaceae bacterium]
MNDRIYTVSELTGRVKRYLDDNEDLHNFFVEGELSNVVYYKSGHLYFNIKDEKAQIKCAAFQYKLKRIPEDLKEGDAVKLFADVGFYENRGEFQILVRHIEKKNVLGDLFAKLEQLKKDMAARGFFNAEHKKSLPKYPRAVGVVTAITGAAVRDIIKTIRKRDPRIDIYIYPAKVQGQGAAAEIAAGIRKLDGIPEIDLIIAGRGGGSIEDLWAFNERETALAFFNCQKPIISAVGHETDFLLTDLTADVRAATPTQAVEICIPEREKIRFEIVSKWRYLRSICRKYFDYLRNELENRQNSYRLKNFGKSLEQLNRKLVDKEAEIARILGATLKERENGLILRKNKLAGLNPLNILERGYSLVTSGGKLVRKAEDVRPGDGIVVRTARDSFTATVDAGDPEKIRS